MWDPLFFFFGLNHMGPSFCRYIINIYICICCACQYFGPPKPEALKTKLHYCPTHQNKNKKKCFTAIINKRIEWALHRFLPPLPEQIMHQLQSQWIIWEFIHLKE